MYSQDSCDNKTNLIINYLPQLYSDEELFSLFSTIGKVVNCKIIRDKQSGYSYGFGFVEFATPHEAQNAIHHLNGCEIENKRIKVALARPPGENTKGANLYVRNIPSTYGEDDLQEQFMRFGKIVQARILLDQITGMSKNVGFVLFERKQDADTAMQEMTGQTLPGGNQPLAIKFADDNAKKVRAPALQGRGGGYGGQMGSFGGYPPRPGGPMRGPRGGGNMRYNPMSSGAVGNGFGSSGGGYSGGYIGGRGRGSNNVPSLRQPTASLGMGQFGSGDGPGDGVILFVYNIGIDATENDLWNLFSPYGTIKKVNVIWDHAQNKCKGYGFVTMSTMDEAKYAIEYLNGFYYKTAPLQVSLKSDKK